MLKITRKEYGCAPIFIIGGIWTLALNIIKYASLGFNELFAQTGIFIFSYTIVLPTVLYFIGFLFTVLLGFIHPKNQNSLLEKYRDLLPYIAFFSFLSGLIAETVTYLFFDFDLIQFFFDWVD